ncbi:hypothetical protein BOW53_01770 [Solemya pervernicosa gill symbiont]|uniref:CheW-like domain-containing protein n=1 Tax=Solemya pervernicosa gill symbiont TaxID=642797 RepID=A0A1T2LA86_9GAMM|nr:chemotaxis protein CheW [Candidatus Reidiella endopervernicosa]OOZ41922.1 hypothetical protein BOW53_01770 [Solemya pervernicosa gill symbiont]
MSQLTTEQILKLLADLSARSVKHASGLPQQEEVKQAWTGIAFRIGDIRLVAPLGEVIEILNYPRLTRVPGAKVWVKGVANVRGNLLPIMDLRGFLGQNATRLHRRSRVLVISHQGIEAGLLIDEVLGLKHFFDEDRASLSAPEVEGLAPFLSDSYRRDSEQWDVFSMRKLAENPAFMKVVA